MFKNNYLKYFHVVIPAALLAFWLPAATAQVAFVLNSAEDTVSLIDTKTYKEISRNRVGREPHHLMATPDDKSLIVANVQSNDLVFFDPITGETQKRVPKISDAYQLGYSPDRKWFVAASLALDRVDIYTADDLKLVKRIATPKGPSHIAFSKDSRHVFVTLQHSNQIGIIDLVEQKLLATLPVGKQPAGIWVTPDDKHVLVGVMGEDFVAVVDWRKRELTQKIRTANCWQMDDVTFRKREGKSVNRISRRRHDHVIFGARNC